jgi:hypothetical protein
MCPGQRHIAAIPFFYMGHALMESGLMDTQPHSDKTQRTSSFWAGIGRPVLALAVLRSRRRRPHQPGKLKSEIERLASLQNSWPALTGRSSTVTTRKPVD